MYVISLNSLSIIRTTSAGRFDIEGEVECVMQARKVVMAALVSTYASRRAPSCEAGTWTVQARLTVRLSRLMFVSKWMDLMIGNTKGRWRKIEKRWVVILIQTCGSIKDSNI